jgi:polysaccharide export outer membrane protein
MNPEITRNAPGRVAVRRGFAWEVIGALLIGLAVATAGCAQQPPREDAMAAVTEPAATNEPASADPAPAQEPAPDEEQLQAAPAEQAAPVEPAAAESATQPALDAEAREAADIAAAERFMAYRVQPGDQLLIDAVRRNELDRTARVDSEGKVTIPYAGAVKVAGLTLPEVTELLTQRLSQYYVDPQLNVSLETSVRQSVYVLGEVKAPGRFQVEAPTPVVDLMGRAAGPTYEGELRNVFIFRAQSDPPMAIKTDVSGWFSRNAKPDWNGNVTVMAGDVVYVPSTLIYDVERFMRRMSAIILPFVRLNDEFVVVDTGD